MGPKASHGSYDRPSKTPRGGSIAKDAVLDVVRRPDGTPVDPQVVTQFNCLQQTGSFCPSMSNGPSMSTAGTAMTGSTSTSTMMSPASAQTASGQAALDALFALMAAQDIDLGLGF
jgi:hypothetical protein